MPPTIQLKPRVFVDADVLFAGSASPTEHGASLIILRMAEITLIEAITSQQVILEVERNLEEKIPKALPSFLMLVSRCLQVTPDPSSQELALFAGLGDSKDMPLLAVAVRETCQWLVTFNVRHFQPGHPDITVLQPGEFILQVRDFLSRMVIREES
jgi:predicted nucleic acid-binding protein